MIKVHEINDHFNTHSHSSWILVGKLVNIIDYFVIKIMQESDPTNFVTNKIVDVSGCCSCLTGYSVFKHVELSDQQSFENSTKINWNCKQQIEEVYYF